MSLKLYTDPIGKESANKIVNNKLILYEAYWQELYDFQAIYKGNYPNVTAPEYGIIEVNNSNILYMTQSDINEVTLKLIREAIKYVTGYFGETKFKTLPLNAQIGVVDIRHNVNHNFDTFTDFIAAIKAQDWNTAAIQSHRKHLTARNRAIRKLFMDLKKADDAKNK